MKRQDYTINGDFIVKSQQQAEILSAVKDIKKKGEMNKVDPKDCSPDCVCENMCGCDGNCRCDDHDPCGCDYVHHCPCDDK